MKKSMLVAGALVVFFARLAYCLGPIFLQAGGYVDYLSKNLPADGIAKFITDSKGRVIKKISTSGLTYQYTYKQ